MSTTYLALTNDLLRRINEVQLTTANFATAKNVQAIAKDAINNSIREILQDGHQFPFLKTAQSQTLASGTATYDFPTDMASVDWDTFYVSQLTSALNKVTFQEMPLEDPWPETYFLGLMKKCQVGKVVKSGKARLRVKKS